MINTIGTILLIILFFFLGHITQAFKKLIGLITKLGLKFLSLFGIKIKKREKHLKQSKEFRDTYKEIKIVKLSKKNIKQKSSIDYLWLGILIVAGLLVFINFKFIGNGVNLITDWIYNLTNGFFGFIKTPADMNTFYTAALFSVLSFSLSKLLARWKETKQKRKEAKEMKLKMKALELMDSKELVDEAKKKDEKNRKRLEK